MYFNSHSKLPVSSNGHFNGYKVLMHSHTGKLREVLNFSSFNSFTGKSYSGNLCLGLLTVSIKSLYNTNKTIKIKDNESLLT